MSKEQKAINKGFKTLVDMREDGGVVFLFQNDKEQVLCFKYKKDRYKAYINTHKPIELYLNHYDKDEELLDFDQFVYDIALGIDWNK